MLKLKSLIIAILLISINNSKPDEYEIKADNVEYKNNNIVIATGNAKAFKSTGEKIFSDKIIYFKNDQLIETSGNSKFLFAESAIHALIFKYDLKAEILTAEGNVKFFDSDKNKFFFDNFKYFKKTETGYGKNIRSYLKDGSYLKAKKGNLDNKNRLINLENTNYTTCSKIKNQNNEFCPSWSLNSKKITHDKNKKRIIHKNSLFKIKKIPILYTPYLSHPDPSVKRQSGFLPPLIKTISNVGRTIQIPYFWALSKDKDITFTPIYYFDQNPMYNSSYRQVFKNGKLVIENSFTKGYKDTTKLKRTPGSRSYFFLQYENKLNNFIYNNSDLTFKIQNVSQQNYLRVNKLNTELFKENIRTLENTVNLKSYSDNKYLEVETGYYKNLDENIKKNQFTYYLPKGTFSYNKNFINKFNFNFNSIYEGKKFSGSQKQVNLKNILQFDSNKYVNRNIGIDSSFKLNFYNRNKHSKNVINSQNGTKSHNNFTLALDSNYPLIKYNKSGYESIKPRLFIKYTSGSMQNGSKLDKILNYNDIYSMNRTNNLEILETGSSAGYGFEYLKTRNKANSYDKFYQSSFGIGQVIKKNSIQNMPVKSSLNNSSSDFAGYFKFDLYGKSKNNNKYLNENIKINFLDKFQKNYLKISYDFNADNKLNELNQNLFNIEGVYNDTLASFTLNEKKKHIGNTKTGELKIKKIVSNNYYLNFEGKKNLKNNQSEYHQISLNFENDCMITSLILSKNFYYDNDLQSSKTLILNILFKPFSDNFGPDLTNFIN